MRTYWETKVWPLLCRAYSACRYTFGEVASLERGDWQLMALLVGAWIFSGIMAIWSLMFEHPLAWLLVAPICFCAWFIGDWLEYECCGFHKYTPKFAHGLAIVLMTLIFVSLLGFFLTGARTEAYHHRLPVLVIGSVAGLYIAAIKRRKAIQASKV